MRKITLFLVTFASISLLAACKKDFNCRCSASYMGISADTTIALGKMTKKDAKSQCSSYQSTFGSVASIFGASVDCEVTN